MSLYFVSIAIDIIAILAVIFVMYAFLVPPLLGAPFVPTKKKTLQRMIELADLKSGERAVDLGSGDGRIVIALAKAGVEAHGYEINPLLVLKSRLAIRRNKLQDSAFIHFKSFNGLDFSQFDVVAIYGLPKIMEQLESRLQSQLPVGGRVVSHLFKFPNWQHKTKVENVYLYLK